MITYEQKQKHYWVQCDRCGHQTYITTARTEQRAKEIATRWGWAFDTEHGDLCQRCAKLWKAGALSKEDDETQTPRIGLLQKP